LFAQRSSAPLPPRNQPKRARKVATPDEGGEGLVGRRVRVYWADDEQYFPGTVAAYDDETVTPPPVSRRVISCYPPPSS